MTAILRLNVHVYLWNSLGLDKLQYDMMDIFIDYHLCPSLDRIMDLCLI